jgi:hypothetical protein
MGCQHKQVSKLLRGRHAKCYVVIMAAVAAMLTAAAAAAAARLAPAAIQAGLPVSSIGNAGIQMTVVCCCFLSASSGL